MKVYAIEILDGAEHDCWVVHEIYATKEAAEAVAKEDFKQSNWGSPVPSYNIQEYEVKES